MPDSARYLLPTERAEIQIRRHWAVLAAHTVQTILLLVLGVLLARILDSVEFAQMIAVYFCIFVVARWVWRIVDWNHEVLIVTDKRLLLLTGIFTRNVAIMPLVKVTDLTFHRSSAGLLLGYGKFVVESAGQDQALSTIDYVPRPERLYVQISELLFGGDKGSPGALVTQAQREAEEEAARSARRRWRRFTRPHRRDDTGPEERSRSSAAPSQLDAILADRDTLLADRDDPDRWSDDRDYDRPERDLRDFREVQDVREVRDVRDGRDEDAYRRPESDSWSARIHDPRGGRGEGIRSDSSLPPPRRPRDSPPPSSGDDPIIND